MSIATINHLPLQTQEKRLLRKLFVDSSPTYDEAILKTNREPGLFSGDDRRALARLASGTSENKEFEINSMGVSTNVKRWLRANAP